MENQRINILDLFRTNPKKAWEIIRSRAGTPINKQEFFNDLQRRKEELEKKKKEEQGKSDSVC